VDLLDQALGALVSKSEVGDDLARHLSKSIGKARTRDRMRGRSRRRRTRSMQTWKGGRPATVLRRRPE
jgi:hypothetical protein